MFLLATCLVPLDAYHRWMCGISVMFFLSIQLINFPAVYDYCSTCLALWFCGYCFKKKKFVIAARVLHQEMIFYLFDTSSDSHKQQTSIATRCWVGIVAFRRWCDHTVFGIPVRHAALSPYIACTLTCFAARRDSIAECYALWDMWAESTENKQPKQTRRLRRCGLAAHWTNMCTW